MQLRCLTHWTSQLTLAYVKHTWNSHINLYLGKNQLTQHVLSNEALKWATTGLCGSSLTLSSILRVWCHILPERENNKIKIVTCGFNCFLIASIQSEKQKADAIYERLCIYAWAYPRCPGSLALDLQTAPLPSALGAELDGQLRSWLSLTGTSAVVTRTRLAFAFINRKHCKCLARSPVKISLLLPMWTLY